MYDSVTIEDSAGTEIDSSLKLSVEFDPSALDELRRKRFREEKEKRTTTEEKDTRHPFDRIADDCCRSEQSTSSSSSTSTSGPQAQQPSAASPFVILREAMKQRAHVIVVIRNKRK